MTPHKIAVDAGEAVVSPSPGTAELEPARHSEQPPASTAPDFFQDAYTIRRWLWGGTVSTQRLAAELTLWADYWRGRSTDTAGRSASPGSAVPCEEGT